MKRTATLSLIFAMFTSSIALAQSGGTKDMEKKDMEMQKSMDMKEMKGGDMKDMDMQKCMNMKEMKGSDTKGMNMKDMDEQKCKDMMNGKSGKHQMKDAKAMTYKAVAVVKDIDAANGKVTLDHEAVKSLNWPAMTMGFVVKDKMLLDRLAVGKKVHVDFKKDGTDYVVTSVK